MWLYRLTNNICIDMLRKNTRAVIVSLQTEDDDGEETEIAIPDERYSPRVWPSAADRDQRSPRPDDCREILALREARGLSYDGSPRRSRWRSARSNRGSTARGKSSA